MNIVNFESRKRQRRTQYHILVLISLLLLLGWAPTHSTAKTASMLEAANGLTYSQLPYTPSLCDTTTSSSSGLHTSACTVNSSFSPFLNIVPNGDGTELFIQAGEVGQLDGAVVTTVDTGTSGHKGSYTMTYSDTAQAYFATATGFTPNVSQAGTINITTTFGLDTGSVDFYRAYVPASTTQTIASQDGNMELTLVTPDTITFDTYVAVVPSFAPPAPPPQGQRIVGSIYSARAANALITTDKPMILRLHYNELGLIGVDPHTLAIFAWDAFNKRWENLGGRLNTSQQYLSVATSRFGAYALMSTSAWRDEFNDSTGLATQSNLIQSTGSTVLVTSPGEGMAVSKIIKPITPIAHWGTLTFAATADPPNTTVMVDVLSLDGIPLLTNVASGISLATIDPEHYPSIRLRARLSSTSAGQTPALDVWGITWEADTTKIFMPLLRR